jgi:hypothetical protein
MHGETCEVIGYDYYEVRLRNEDGEKPVEFNLTLDEFCIAAFKNPAKEADHDET